MTDITKCANEYNSCNEIHMNQAYPGFISGIILKLKTAYQRYQQRKIDRDAFRTMLNLDEASLKDIGVTRDDIIYASKLAMNESASKELEKIRATNIATARWK